MARYVNLALLNLEFNYAAFNRLTIVQLTQGTLVTVPASLVKRSKNHFHNLLCGASVILGNNGYIWISPLVSDDHAKDGGMRFQTPSNPAASSVETTTKVCCCADTTYSLCHPYFACLLSL